MRQGIAHALQLFVAGEIAPSFQLRLIGRCGRYHLRKRVCIGHGCKIAKELDLIQPPAYSSLFAVAKAQSSQPVSALTSLVSTVAPHQMRRPEGASR
jgi:hypothetical protein